MLVLFVWLVFFFWEYKRYIELENSIYPASKFRIDVTQVFLTFIFVCTIFNYAAFMQIFKEQLFCKFPLNIWRTLFGGYVMKIERKIVTLRLRRRLRTIGLRHITNILSFFRYGPHSSQLRLIPYLHHTSSVLR